MVSIVLHAYHEGDCPVQIVDFEWRTDFIKENKPESEHKVRLALMKKIPLNHLPVKAREPAKRLMEATDTYDKALDAYEKALDAYDKARDAYEKELDAYEKARDAYEKERIDLFKARSTFEASLTPEEWGAWHEKHCKDPRCAWTPEHPNIFKEYE